MNNVKTFIAIAAMSAAVISCNNKEEVSTPVNQVKDLTVAVVNNQLSNARTNSQAEWIDQSLITMALNGSETGTWTWTAPKDGQPGKLNAVPFGPTEFVATYLDPVYDYRNWNIAMKLSGGETAKEALDLVRAEREHPLVDYIGTQDVEVTSQAELETFEMIAQQGRITLGVALEDQEAGKFFHTQVNFQLKDSVTNQPIYNKGGAYDYVYIPESYGWAIDLSDRKMLESSYASFDITVSEVSSINESGDKVVYILDENGNKIQHSFHFDGNPNVEYSTSHEGMRHYGMPQLSTSAGIAKGLAITIGKDFTVTVKSFEGLTFDFSDLKEVEEDLIITK